MLLPDVTDVLPLMAPGWAGTEQLTATDKVLAALEPQLLFAFTEIVPPADPAVAVIEVVVEVPLQPEGNVHV